MSLNKAPNKKKEKSNVITFNMPGNNADMQTAIDSELNKGWHIQGLFHDTIRDKLRIIFTKPKRN